MSYRRIAQLRTAAEFREYLQAIGVALDFDEVISAGSGSPLAQPLHVHGHTVGNRFAVLPMEGWDALPDGSVSDLVQRRWQRFGQSGAKLIWGCEAVAIRDDARANPNQLVINENTASQIARLRESLLAAHVESFVTTNDLLIGLQLTHSGRFSRPADKKRLEPKILYSHPVLNPKFHLPEDYPVLTDDEIDRIIQGFGDAAVLAQQAGFTFVDVKHCHGYLGHEFLTAVDRQGKYGGSFENRTRFLRNVVEEIHRRAPGLHIGVRLSAFDMLPFRPGSENTGVPETYHGDYRYAFGGRADGIGIDLTEPHQFLNLLESLGIQLVCITAGSPYYNPHIQRPALFPPSDGYQPPEDPLVGVARQIAATATLKRQHPNLVIVGSGYSYLQEWLPNVAHYVVGSGMADLVGLGRMMLSYPEIVRDILDGKTLERKRICRTFSDCTTAPRNGLISGCYPLDEFYKTRTEAKQLAEIKHPDKSEGVRI